MQVTTLLRYLLGHRTSIQRIANCRSAVWLGLVFVISAGFAREYDVEDLLHEPWYVLLPLAASLITSSLLFVLVQCFFKSTSFFRPNLSELAKYRAFLGLYWMTAPLAWLYAIPVERFLDEADAVRANLMLLGIVSAWRVALMSRVVSVIYQRSFFSSFLVVMLFADSVAMAVFYFTPLPILDFMGGIQLTESEQVVLSTTLLVRAIGTVTLPFWLLACAAMKFAERRSPAPTPNEEIEHPRQPVSLGLWLSGAMSLLIWAPILPFTQDEQIRRHRVEADLRAGKIDEAIEYMSRFDRNDFPSHWDPPPRLGYQENQPPIIELLMRLEELSPRPWVQELFVRKLVIQSRADRHSLYAHLFSVHQIDDEKLARYVRFVQSVPEASAIARMHEIQIKASFDPEDYGLDQSLVPPLTDSRRASLEALQKLIPKEQSGTAQ